MRRYSEAVKVYVRMRMSPPMRESVSHISAEMVLHVGALFKWRKAWQLQSVVMLASEKEPEDWSAADKLTVVLATACHEYHRAQRLLQGTGSVPGAGLTLAQGHP